MSHSRRKDEQFSPAFRDALLREDPGLTEVVCKKSTSVHFQPISKPLCAGSPSADPRRDLRLPEEAMGEAKVDGLPKPASSTRTRRMLGAPAGTPTRPPRPGGSPRAYGSRRQRRPASAGAEPGQEDKEEDSTLVYKDRRAPRNRQVEFSDLNPVPFLNVFERSARPEGPLLTAKDLNTGTVARTCSGCTRRPAHPVDIIRMFKQRGSHELER
jgi:hypothetical protein